MTDGERPAPPALADPPSRRPHATTRPERPVADEVYRIYAGQYAYDRTPLEARVEKTDDAKPALAA